MFVQSCMAENFRRLEKISENLRKIKKAKKIRKFKKTGAI